MSTNLKAKGRFSMGSLENDKRSLDRASNSGTEFRHKLRNARGRTSLPSSSFLQRNDGFLHHMNSNQSNQSHDNALDRSAIVSSDADDKFSVASVEGNDPSSEIAGIPLADKSEMDFFDMRVAVANILTIESQIVPKAIKQTKNSPKTARMKRLSDVSSFGHIIQEEVIAKSGLSASAAFPIGVDAVGPSSFRKLKILGQGAAGTVYLVLLRGTDKFYAMKELTKEGMLQRKKVARVKTEREILATANHPFIVTL
jgi:hypothetical protein